MSTSLSLPTTPSDGRAHSAEWRFALTALAVAGMACLLAGWLPLGFSIVTVFLFAGPHNWMEARYFMSRMPARWGPLQGYFLTGIAGVLALATGFAVLSTLAESFRWDDETWLTAAAVWDTGLILWIMRLVVLRSRQHPRREWPAVLPIGLGVIGLVWLWPQQWDLVLVYLHPLVALWFLDRELGRCRPEWRAPYRASLMCVPALLGVLWWQLAGSPPLPGSDALSERITNHAGGNILTDVSSHLLVSTHTFLEMLHYGVWLVAIPLVTLPSAPWRLDNVPLARRTSGWRPLVLGLLIAGGVMVLAFWAGFLADYPLTRDVYFTVAMLHVLAEVPFLLRLL
jgi:hypothetical protein